MSREVMLPKKPRYRFQRVYSGLHSGQILTVRSKRQLPVPVFFRQSDIDSACGLHVVVMMLTMFDLGKACAFQYMTRRKFGVPAAVWAAFKESFFDGIDTDEMVEAVQSLELPIRMTAYYDRETPTAAMRHLMAGDVLAVAIVSLANQKTNHWILAVGVSGLTSASGSEPDTILALDPSFESPKWREWNARLQVPKGWTTENAIKRNRFTYAVEDCVPEPVKVASAVLFRLTD